MARVSPEIQRILPVLDAEADEKLAQLQLPFWVALYRLRKSDGGKAHILLMRRGHHLEAARRGLLTTIKGATLVVAAIITDANDLSPAAQYLMRLLMLKKRENEPDGIKARRYLLAHPPSSHPAAKHLAAGKKKADAAREAEWARWQRHGDLLRQRHPSWSKSRLAEHIKLDLKLGDSVRTIRHRL